MVTTSADGKFLEMAASFVVFALYFVWTRVKLAKISLPSMTSKDINKHEEIKTILTEFRVLLDCDRINVFQLHNGDYFLSGQSIQKISLTHFAARKGIATDVKELQNIPASFFSSMLQDLIINKLRESFSRLETDEFVKHYMVHSGAAHNVCHILMSIKSKNPIGVLSVSWLNEKALTDKDRSLICNLATLVQSELNWIDK